MRNALAKIRQSGFQIALDESGLIISPFSKLTPPQVLFLKSHKAEIIQALKLEQSANDKNLIDDDRHYCHECQNLINGWCVASPTRYSPVDTIPRRCVDFVMGRTS
jgi:EAL domain-containing protein (putative c-di-GMP-specific phosphodiesterase class I)